MKLHEIGDTTLDFPMETKGQFHIGGFNFDDKPYILQLHNTPIPFTELKGKTTAEVSFFRGDISGDNAFGTVGDLHDIPFKVYSVITNRLASLSKDYDAFYFVAERRHSVDDTQYGKKVRIYQYLANQFQKKTGWWYYEADNPFRAVVSKEEIKHDGFKNPLDEAVKSLDRSNFPSIP